mgnify:CR=1 FL=1
METYAEILVRKEREFQIKDQETFAQRKKRREQEAMSNYDMDEIERQKERERKSRGIRSIEKVRSVVEIGKDETPYTAVDIEISDDVFRKVAFQAHERDITFNKMVGIILKAELQSSEHRFEHHNSPQVLKEY